MKVLKNPVVAVLLAALIVVSSSLISSGIKLEKECRKVTDGFYQGVKHSGSKHPAIYTQLKSICGAVSGMVTLADSYGIDTAEVSALQGELDASVSEMHNGISAIYKKYDALNGAVMRLVRELEDTKLSKRDKDGLELYRSTIDTAKAEIKDAGYNESVQSYISGCTFPKDLFIALTDTALPEFFA